MGEHGEGLGAGGRIILKFITEKYVYDWIQLAQDRTCVITLIKKNSLQF
jgi:hypothetical protein